LIYSLNLVLLLKNLLEVKKQWVIVPMKKC